MTEDLTNPPTLARVASGQDAAARPGPPETLLVADIGGTYARFGLVRVPVLASGLASGFDAELASGLDSGLAVRDVETFACADYRGPATAAKAYLARRDLTVRRAAIAVASPVIADRIALTNSPWRFSRRRLRDALSLDQLVVLNDFAALALALPSLGARDYQSLQVGDPAPGAPCAVLGPGTGLGVSALLPDGAGGIVLPTEGGHRDLAATGDREWDVIRTLSTPCGHVSAEAVLSGAGLVRLEATLRQLEGQHPDPLASPGARERDASDVVAAARDAASGRVPAPFATEAIHLFTGWLGAVAGDLVLTLGARGGLYLGGGMLPKMASVFDRQVFLQRFLDKGRFRNYLQHTPVRLITDPAAALRGAGASLLRREADPARAASSG